MKKRKLKRRVNGNSRPKLRSAFPITSRKLQNRKLNQTKMIIKVHYAE